jgi:benzoyl-CoA reductase subunit C
MDNKMNYLKEMVNAAKDPLGYAVSMKKRSGKKIIGYICSYAPEEIIYASGSHPLRIFGGAETSNMADAHLQAYCCSLVRGSLESGLSGNLAFLDGMVFPHTCDSIQRLSDIWRINIALGLQLDVVHPVKLNTDSARQYMADVLGRFRRELESGLGTGISDEALRESIGKYNRLRSYLGKLYGLRSKSPGVISGSDLFAIVKASMVMDRDWLLEALPAVIRQAEDGADKLSLPGKKRIVLSGGPCDYPDLYGMIEEAGGTVVGDDLCVGSRSFDGMIDGEGDPIAAIAKRYIDRPVCPAKHRGITERADSLIKTVRGNNAGGVLFLILKFCEPHSFDYPYMREYLEREKVPSTLIEFDDKPNEAQVRTRIQAFLEMI